MICLNHKGKGHTRKYIRICLNHRKKEHTRKFIRICLNHKNKRHIKTYIKICLNHKNKRHIRTYIKICLNHKNIGCITQPHTYPKMLLDITNTTNKGDDLQLLLGQSLDNLSVHHKASALSALPWISYSNNLATFPIFHEILQQDNVSCFKALIAYMPLTTVHEKYLRNHVQGIWPESVIRNLMHGLYGAYWAPGSFDEEAIDQAVDTCTQTTVLAQIASTTLAAEVFAFACQYNAVNCLEFLFDHAPGLVRVRNIYSENILIVHPLAALSKHAKGHRDVTAPLDSNSAIDKMKKRLAQSMTGENGNELHTVMPKFVSYSLCTKSKAKFFYEKILSYVSDLLEVGLDLMERNGQNQTVLDVLYSVIKPYDLNLCDDDDDALLIWIEFYRIIVDSDVFDNHYIFTYRFNPLYYFLAGNRVAAALSTPCTLCVPLSNLLHAALTNGLSINKLLRQIASDSPVRWSELYDNLAPVPSRKMLSFTEFISHHGTGYLSESFTQAANCCYIAMLEVLLGYAIDITPLLTLRPSNAVIARMMHYTTHPDSEYRGFAWLGSVNWPPTLHQMFTFCKALILYFQRFHVNMLPSLLLGSAPFSPHAHYQLIHFINDPLGPTKDPFDQLQHHPDTKDLKEAHEMLLELAELAKILRPLKVFAKISIMRQLGTVKDVGHLPLPGQLKHFLLSRGF